MGLLALVDTPGSGEIFLQFCLVGLTTGSLFALIALGYTMVYGIVEMINFAHGDVFMLGSLLALALVSGLRLESASLAGRIAGLAITLLACMVFCAVVSVVIDRLVYRPLRHAPKLAPLVSGVGASFVLGNIGLLWLGAADHDFPDLVSRRNLLGETAAVQITMKDLMVLGITAPIMIGLTLFVKRTSLGRAMRATAQNPMAARLMGIDVDRVVMATFAIGGALAGAASLIYGLYINTVSYQMGFQNGLYAFTAAVLGGIGNIPGAVVGGIVLGLTRSLGSAYVGERWTTSLIFVILIVILVFKPSGLLGTRVPEKV